MWIDRLIKTDVERAVESRPAVLVTGMRQAGKSSLLRRLFPEAAYETLDRIIRVTEAQENSTFFRRFHLCWKRKDINRNAYWLVLAKSQVLLD